jgi:hypothetical protein
METIHITAIHDFDQAVTELVVRRDGIEATPTYAVEAALRSLPPVWEAIEANPDWPQIMPLRHAVAAAGALLTTLNVVHEDDQQTRVTNQAIVVEFLLAWGEWLQSRLDAAKKFIDNNTWHNPTAN